MSRRHKNDYSPDVGKRQRIDSIPEPRRGSPYVRTPHLRPCHDEEEAGFLRFSNGFDHNCHSQSSEELPEVLIVPHIPDSLDSYARDKVLLDFSFVQFYIRPLTATYFLKSQRWVSGDTFHLYVFLFLSWVFKWWSCLRPVSNECQI